MAYKPCNTCGKDIGFRKEGDKTLPINPDGSPHRCRTQAGATAAATPTICTARLDAFTSGSATFRVKGGRSKTYAILGSMATEWKAAGWKQGTWLEFTLDARNFVQGPKEVPEPAWGKDLEAQQEIAPAQPVQKPAAAAAPQQETRTSPESSAPATARSTDRPGPRDIFTSKDRLIVTQCLVKAYTDLWVSTNTPDSVTFDDAIEDILTAVKRDLPRVMEIGGTS
jgi:hypothetical protein